MAPRSRGTAVLIDTIINGQSRTHICRSCRKTIQQSRHASTATAQATIESPPISNVSQDEPGASPVAQPRIVVKAGVVVSRAPLLTPEPHPFDTAFYLYQRRLNERLVLPFSQYFHYKRGTPAFEHWRAERRKRGGVAARDLGKYNAYTKESWNDEALIGDKTADPERVVEQLIAEEGRGAEFVDEGADARLAGLKRATEADQKNDQTSLERSLSRTLYLLVRNKVESEDADAATAWRFPNGDVETKEGLKEAAQRVLSASCGPNMNTWFIANHPIGHHIDKIAETDSEALKAEMQAQTTDPESEKTFFMKARIFAGQVDLQSTSFGIEEFKWLSKEEIEKHVTPEYWNSVKNMLVSQ